MFEVDAIGYEGVICEALGACEPIIVSVKVGLADDVFEVVAKLSDKLPLRENAYVAEAISSLLAGDLKLPTPTPYAVALSNEFISSVHDKHVRARMEGSSKLVFGSHKLPASFKVVPKDLVLGKATLQTAAEIFAFDALIENPDRGGSGKQNCLMEGDKFAMIDHEKAFPQAGGAMLLGYKKPWQLGALDHFRAPSSHLFVNQLLKFCGKIELGDFVARWSAIDDNRISSYGSALPPSWVADTSCVAKILQHIKDVRDNMGGCITEIERVLGK